MDCYRSCGAVDRRTVEGDASLTLGMGVQVSERLVANLMSLAGIYGLPGPPRVKRLRGIVTADDLVNRTFHRLSPNGDRRMSEPGSRLRLSGERAPAVARWKAEKARAPVRLKWPLRGGSRMCLCAGCGLGGIRAGRRR